MSSWWRDFFRLAGWFPGLTIAAVALCCAAAVLEGIGLAALIPALDVSIAGGERPAGPWAWWLPSDRSSWALLGVVAFVTLAGAASIARFSAEAVLLRLRTEIEHRAREIMGRALLKSAWPTFVTLKLGDISKAQVAEGMQMGAGTQVFVQALGALVASLAYLTVALSISVRLTLYTVAFGLVGAAMYVLVGRWARRHADELSNILSSIGERVSEIFFGLKFIRSTGLVPEAERQANSLYESWRRSFFVSQLYAIGTRQSFELMGLAFIAVFLGVTLRGGAGGVPAALVFLGVFYRLAPRLLAVQDGFFQARTFHSWVVSWDQRRTLAEAAVEPPGGTRPPRLEHQLEFKDVSYKFPGASSYALADISLAVPVGEAIGLIGASGSGKSTLLDLITGLLAPSNGSILLDGVALSEVDLLKWRRRIGLVQQDTPMIHGTVLENIAWGDASPDLTLARDCAEKAGALAFVEALPAGFETVIGERGGRLSGGQRQRLALARALYRRPELLILDEPTSALDSESEAAVRAALEGIKGTCTMLIVAHRLDTVKFCDRIVALDAGRVVDAGAWSQLAARPDSVLSRMLAVQQTL